MPPSVRFTIAVLVILIVVLGGFLAVVLTALTD